MTQPLMIDRRRFLEMAAGAGASLALTPELLRALQALRQPSGKLIQRAIPSTGEMLPVVSLDPRRESDDAGMREILRTMLEHGARVIDFPDGGGERTVRAAAVALGIQDRLFWTTPLVGAPPRRESDPPPPKADAAALRAQIETKLATFGVPRIDLVMASAYNVTHDPTFLAVLTELKKEGKVRYVGVHTLAPPPYPTGPAFASLEAIMRNEPIDFVGTDYSAGWRGVEERILPLARERKIGFMAHFAFDRGRLFRRVSGTPLPDWAAEFDATTWAQFFLKYVVSHPAVTVVRVGTTKPAHMLENIGGGVGRLPNEAMRKRMAELVDALPQPPMPPATNRSRAAAPPGPTR